MNKKDRDRNFNKWVIAFMCGPASLMSLFAFVIGYWYPEKIGYVQSIAEITGLHHVVAIRTQGSIFNTSAYFFWLTFWIGLPFNVFWIIRIGVIKKMPATLRAVAKSNLDSGIWKKEKFTLTAGRIKFFVCILFFTALFVVQIAISQEPSYCEGCETNSIVGFLIFNWLGLHVSIVAVYMSCSYLVMWKSIIETMEKNDE